MLSFSSKLTVYVPSTEYSAKISDRDFAYRVSDVQHSLSHYFGGSTAVHNANGAWIDDDNQLILEDIVLVSSSNSSANIAEKLPDIVDQIFEYLVIWSQYAISLEIDGRLFIIFSDDNPSDVLTEIYNVWQVETVELETI